MEFRRFIGDSLGEYVRSELQVAVDALLRTHIQFNEQRERLEAAIAKVTTIAKLGDGCFDALPNPPGPYGLAGGEANGGIKVPNEPGIYFLYDKDDCLAYVGKAIDLDRRAGSGIGNHHLLSQGHGLAFISKISWLIFEDLDVDELAFIECFYIWFARPYKNFGYEKKRQRKLMEARVGE